MMLSLVCLPSLCLQRPCPDPVVRALGQLPHPPLADPHALGVHMSFVTTQPQPMAALAGSLQCIGSATEARNRTAAASRTQAPPAAINEAPPLNATQSNAIRRANRAVPGRHNSPALRCRPDGQLRFPGRPASPSGRGQLTGEA